MPPVNLPSRRRDVVVEIHLADQAVHEVNKLGNVLLGNLHVGEHEVVKIGLKLFTGQTWSYMLGYCQKDRGQSHFRFWSINVSDRELEVGDRTYKRVRTQSHCYFNFELAH